MLRLMMLQHRIGWTLFFLLVASCLVVRAQDGNDGLPPGYKMLFRTDFSGKGTQGLFLQGPRKESLTVVANPEDGHGRVLKVAINKHDNFSKVANGTPRAEISFANAVRFESGKEYWISWSILIPRDFRFDSKQPEGISQIHGGPGAGVPPFNITLTGQHYQVDLRNGSAVEHHDLGSAEQDKGRWVAWSFHYRPDSGGAEAISELVKDGQMILGGNGRPNAYLNDNGAYFKFGIYKWWWNQRPSDVNERTIYFGDVVIGVKE